MTEKNSIYQQTAIVKLRNRFADLGLVSVLCILTGFLFAFTFWFPQTFEDYLINSRLSRTNWTTILQSYGSVYSIFSPFYRPTAEIIQWALIQIFGVGDFGQHIGQYMFPCLSTFLLYKIVYKLTSDRLASAWAGFLFLVSGVQMTHFLIGSTYIFDRTALLFMLLGLWGVLNRWPLLSVCGLFLALTSKETAVIFPGLYCALILAICMTRERGVMRLLDEIRSRWLEVLLLSAVYVGFLGFRYYHASSSGLTFVELMRGGAGRYELESNLSLTWRNLLILSAYVSELGLWWSIPGKSFDVAHTGETDPLWIVFPVISIISMVWGLRQYFRGKAGVNCIYVLGGLWFIVSIFPFLFIVPQFRVMNYLAYIPSVGASLVMAGVITELTRLVAGRTRRCLIRFNVCLALLVCWMVLVWQPYSVYANSWLRAHIKMGVRSVSYLVETLKERALPLRDKQLYSIGMTNEQLKAIPIVDLLDLHLERPQRFENLHAFGELVNLHDYWTSSTSSQQLIVFPLTDRFAIWKGGAAGGEVLAGLNLINGNFAAGEHFPEGWRPLGWVPAGIRAGVSYKSLPSRRGVRIANVLPGMADGLEQKFVCGEGRYEVSLGLASGNGGRPTVEIRSLWPVDVVERFTFPPTEELTYRKATFDVRTTSPYSLVIGSTGTASDWMTVSEISISRVGNSEGTAAVENKLNAQLLPSLPKINGLVPTDNGVYKLIDDSTTASMGVFHLIDTDPVADWTKYRVRLEAKAVKSEFVDVMVTPVYDNPDHYEDNDLVVKRLHISEDWQNVSGTFSIRPYCKRIRLHIVPYSSRAGKEALGSIDVRRLELELIDIPVTNLPVVR